MRRPDVTTTQPAADVETTPVVVPEPHAERPARPGEFCSYCCRRAFVIYIVDGREIRWCGWPERKPA
jgi:hypothetical protein